MYEDLLLIFFSLLVVVTDTYLNGPCNIIVSIILFVHLRLNYVEELV